MSKPALQLSQEDIQRLIQSPFDKKMYITKKIAQYYSMGGFGENEMNIAETLFRVLVKDVETKIRQNLAESIKDLDNVPKDVVLDLANDISEISIPVLKCTEVLDDEDLVEIIRSTEDSTKQVAISERSTVSEEVSNALIDTGKGEVIKSVLENKGANISEDSYKSIVSDFSENENILESMVDRDALPPSVIENLSNIVSSAIQQRLKERHQDAFKHIDNIAQQSAEIATMKVMGMQSTEDEFRQFKHLMSKLKITEDLMPIYALCLGNSQIFEILVARRTLSTVMNIKTLMQDATNRGLKAIYERAELPETLYDATEILVVILRSIPEHQMQRTSLVSRSLSQKILNRVMEEIDTGKKIENIDYIISLLKHGIATGS